MRSQEPLFSHVIVTLAPSWHCDARCLHCYLPAGLRNRDRYRRETFLRALRRLPPSVRAISFTGGEPFLHFRRFVHLLRQAAARGYASTVVTNALWAIDQGRRDHHLFGAYDAGLRGLAISVDDYHRPQVPIAVIVDLLVRARELGMAVNVRGVGDAARGKIAAVRQTGVLAGQYGAQNLYDLDNIGAASRLPPDRIHARRMLKCTSALTPLVVHSGDVFACCSSRVLQIRNPVLHLGNVNKQSLVGILDRSSRDYLLAAIVAFGPGMLARWVGWTSRERSSMSQCEACVTLLNNPHHLRVLRRRIEGDVRLRRQIAGRCMVYESCRPSILPQVARL